MLLIKYIIRKTSNILNNNSYDHDHTDIAIAILSLTFQNYLGTKLEAIHNCQDLSEFKT